MAATIQTIETPKRARALDTSTSYQAISAELFVTADASSIVNEADATSSGTGGWTATDASIAVEDIVTYNGSHAIKYTATDNGGRIVLDLNDFCTIGKLYEISVYARHAGDVPTDNVHHVRMSPISNLSTGDPVTENLYDREGVNTAFQEGEAADETYQERFKRFIHSSDTRYFGVRESGGDDAGSMYLDSLSIKEVESFGSNNHGQIYSGRALEFDGVSDSLTGPTTFPHSNTTVAIWINQDNATAEYRGIVARNTGSAQDSNWAVWWNGGKIYNYVGDGSSYDTIPSNTTLENGTWYRIVVTFDFDNKTCKTYINGILDDTHVWTIVHRTTSDAISIGRLSVAGAQIWEGKLSDAQIWNTLWTQSDVTYDYLNPEQLALNNGGTSLTESNLKLWYPMQDGHRGQQSYILDGANTGLGDEEIVNGGFPTGSGDWNADNGGTIINNEMSLDCGTTTNAYTFQTKATAYTLGTSYKVTISIVSNTTGASLVLYDFTNAPHIGNITIGSAAGTYTVYFTPDYSSGTGKTLSPRVLSSTGIMVIDNISVKPINAKNHATTVFYGDMSELLDSDQKTFFGDSLSADDNTFDFGENSDSGDLADSNGFTEVNNADLEPNEGSEYGRLLNAAAESGYAHLPLRLTTVVGRTYDVKFDVIAGDTSNINVCLQDNIATDLVLATRNRTFAVADGALDGDDAGNNSWNAGAGVAISIVSQEMKVLNDDTSNNYAFYQLPTTVGDIYRVKITLVSESGTSAPEVAISNSSNGSPVIVEDDNIATSDVVDLEFTATATTTYVVLKTGSSTSGHFTTWDNFSWTRVFNSVNDSGSKDTGTNYRLAKPFVATSTTTTLVLRNVSATSGHFSYIDNLTVQEVGQATGWTNADQQLDIPQTALQSYNQLAWFDGENTSCATLDSNIDTEGNSYSLSFWLLNHANDSTYDWIIGSTTGKFSLTIKNSDRRLYYRAGNILYNAISDAAIPTAEWMHIVVTAIGDTSMTAYINGVSQTTVTSMEGDYEGVTIPDTKLHIERFMQGYPSDHETVGSITEISYYTDVLTQAEVNDLYNDGKAKDARDASGNGNLANYWRNNGLAEWKDLTNAAGTGNNANTSNTTETLLLPAGVDGSRDNQGFIMNRQRTTSSLNLDGDIYGKVNDGDSFDFGTTAFTIQAWVKPQTMSADDRIITKGVTGNGEWMISIGADNASLRVYAKDSAAVAIDSANEFSVLTLDTWSFITVIIDTPNDEVLFYKDDGNVETKGGSNFTGNFNNDHPITIGTNSSLATTRFDGRIDDVCIYSDKLEVAEIKRNYKAGKRSHR